MGAHPQAEALGRRRALVRLALAALFSFALTSMAFDYLPGGLSGWHEHYASFAGRAPNQLRVASFLVPELLTRLDLAVDAAYLTVHWILLALAFWILPAAVERALAPRALNAIEDLAVVAALALLYGFGLQRVIQPVDAWALLVAVLLLRALFASQHRSIWIGLVLCLAAVSKENAFLYSLLVAVWWIRQRGVVWGLGRYAVVLLPAAVLYSVLRLAIDAPGGPRNEGVVNVALVLGAPLSALRPHPFNSWAWAGEVYWVLLFVPVWLLCGGLWASLDRRYRELLLVVVPVLVANLVFGIPRELRIFIDGFVFLLPSLLRSLELLGEQDRPFSLRGAVARSGVLLAATLAATATLGVLLPSTAAAGPHGVEGSGSESFHWVDRSAIVSFYPPVSRPFALRLQAGGRRVAAGEAIAVAVLTERISGTADSAVIDVGGFGVDVAVPASGDDPVSGLRLETPYTFIPALEGQSSDRRQLSFRVSGLGAVPGARLGAVPEPAP